MPDWIDEEFERLQQRGNPPALTDEQISQAATQWWEHLAQDVQHALERVRERDGSADFSQPRPERIEITNSKYRLKLSAELDPDARTVHFEYHSDAPRVSEPLGGFFSLRPRGPGRVVPYYADEELSQEQVLKTLLKPVLFPAVPSDEAA